MMTEAQMSAKSVHSYVYNAQKVTSAQIVSQVT